MPVYASCTRRFFACMIDGIILNAPVIFIMTAQGMSAIFTPWFMPLQAAIGALYITLFESSATQASPGKMALGLRVATAEGARLSPWLAFKRHLLYIMPMLPIMAIPPTPPGAQAGTGMVPSSVTGVIYVVMWVVYFALYWMPMIFTKQKTALHDMLSATRVVRKQSA